MPPLRPKPQPEPVINVTKLMGEWSAETSRDQKVVLATKLGVSVQSLEQLECAWCRTNRAWAFTMRDGYGERVGIRLRADDGRKWAVTGSHAGIFLPQCEPQAMGFVVEGPSDAAAALTLGFFAVGRPSCSGGMGHVRTAFSRLGVRRAIIVADNDDPGLRGADMLSRQLPIPTCTLVLPVKDFRDFVKAGGDAACVNSMLRGLVWKKPNEEHA